MQKPQPKDRIRPLLLLPPMNLLLRLIVSTIAVLVADLALPGVEAKDLVTGLLVALVLALLNTFL